MCQRDIEVYNRADYLAKSNTGPQTFDDLAVWLNSLGITTTYGTPFQGARGCAKVARTAWDYYIHLGDQEAAQTIAWAFTKKNGEYAYYDY